MGPNEPVIDWYEFPEDENWDDDEWWEDDYEGEEDDGYDPENNPFYNSD